MVGTPMIGVPAEATPRRQTRASHARVPTLTTRPDEAPADQDDRPYGLASPSRQGRDSWGGPPLGGEHGRAVPVRSPGAGGAAARAVCPSRVRWWRTSARDGYAC